MLIVNDLARLPEYGFNKTEVVNGSGLPVYVKQIGPVGVGDDCSFALVVNPVGPGYVDNELIQNPAICKSVADIVKESHELDEPNLMLDMEFPVETLMQMVTDGAVRYVPSKINKEEHVYGYEL